MCSSRLWHKEAHQFIIRVQIVPGSDLEEECTAEIFLNMTVIRVQTVDTILHKVWNHSSYEPWFARDEEPRVWYDDESLKTVLW